jgi:hypothetical protein
VGDCVVVMRVLSETGTDSEVRGERGRVFAIAPIPTLRWLRSPVSQTSISRTFLHELSSTNFPSTQPLGFWVGE